MEPESLYQHLKELAEKLGVVVTEANLKKAGIRSIKSGMCKVKNQPVFLMDKRHSLKEKIEIMTDWLREMDIDDVYLIPAVRERIERTRDGKTRKPAKRTGIEVAERKTKGKGAENPESAAEKSPCHKS